MCWLPEIPETPENMVYQVVSRMHAESARQHDEILAALADGDAAAASARTYLHIMGADPVKEETE